VARFWLKSKWLLALLALSGTLAWAEEPVVVDVDIENPPFMYAKDGQAKGIYPALVKEAFSRMKVPVTLAARPWKRVIEEIDQGMAGVAGIYSNEERRQKYDYSDVIMVENIAVFYHQDNPVIFENLDSLSGKRVGTIRGWLYTDEFSEAGKSGKLTIDEVSGDEKNFEKLEAKRVDAVLAIEQSGNALLATGRFPSVKMNSQYLSSAESFLAFNKSANKQDLLTKFNAAIKEMKADGSFDRIVAEEANR
jgi:polar amino acid transport system substrate-binding protein